MEIEGYLAAQIQSISQLLDMPVPKVIEKFLSLFIDSLDNDQVFKLLAVTSEEEADKLFEEVLNPVMATMGNNTERRFRVWYDDRNAPSAWVVDALKPEDLYSHPFVSRWVFSEYPTAGQIIRKAFELGVKPEEIHLVQ